MKASPTPPPAGTVDFERAFNAQRTRWSDFIRGVIHGNWSAEDAEKFVMLNQRLAFTAGEAAERKRAAEVLLPNWAGQFRTFQHWVDHASRYIDKHAVCIDAKGRRCLIGKDFMRARDENAFPVRYFWDCAAAIERGAPGDSSCEASAKQEATRTGGGE